MSNTQTRLEFRLAVVLVIIGIGSRLLFSELGIFNFNAVSAAAMFAGAYLLRTKWSYAIPVATMLLTDALLGFYYAPSMIINYSALVLTMYVGSYYSKKPSLLRYVGVVAGGTISFFLITNFGSWLFQTMEPKLYSMDISGLMLSYTYGLPFIQNSILSNFVFSAILFGGFEMAKVFLPKGRTAIA